MLKPFTLDEFYDFLNTVPRVIVFLWTSMGIQKMGYNAPVGSQTYADAKKEYPQFFPNGEFSLDSEFQKFRKK